MKGRAFFSFFILLRDFFCPLGCLCSYRIKGKAFRLFAKGFSGRYSSSTLQTSTRPPSTRKCTSLPRKGKPYTLLSSC